MTLAAALRAEFPVLERLAYLNAGTDGPIAGRRRPAAAREDARRRAPATGASTRTSSAAAPCLTELREGYAALLGGAPDDVALTTSTSEGLGRCWPALDLGPATRSSPRPGAPGADRRADGRPPARRRVRAAPFARAAEAVGPTPRSSPLARQLGRRGDAPAALAELDVPVILDGAQGAGAVPSTWRRSAATPTPRPARSGCAAPTAPACSGSPPRSASASPVAPATCRSRTPRRGLESPLRDDGARYDTPVALARGGRLRSPRSTCSSAAGWPPSRSARPRARRSRTARGAAVTVSRAARRRSSLGGRRPEADRDRAPEAGVIVRDLPGRRSARLGRRLERRVRPRAPARRRSDLAGLGVDPRAPRGRRRPGSPRR